MPADDTPRDPAEQMGHLVDGTPPAPGDLELVRAFVSLHDHAPSVGDTLPPSSATIEAYLRSKDLLDAEAVTGEGLRWAGTVLEALRARIAEGTGRPHDAAADRVLDDAVTRTGLMPRFGDPARPIASSATGIQAAVGRLLAVAFLATLDDSWGRFRECSESTCRAVFWDRSKNRSGRWCSMASCGNRAKVRAYRERHASR